MGLEWHESLFLLLLDIRVKHVHLPVVVASHQQPTRVRSSKGRKEHFASFQLPSALPGLHIIELDEPLVPAHDQAVAQEGQLPGTHDWHVDHR